MESTPVIQYFKELQDRLTQSLLDLDPSLESTTDPWKRESGGRGVTCVFSGGDVVEKGGINFSHIQGKSLPASASAKRPELADRSFEASGVSVVFHPRNPFVPTTHMNVRFFRTTASEDMEPVWWFGGGYDLTPIYPFEEDAISWHRAARAACQPLGEDSYREFKKNCDVYFYLPHRQETRGIGGLFFDDLNEPDFQTVFNFTQEVGNSFFPAWAEIADKRHPTSYDDHHRKFQEYRRGRYVEFNLLFDRGTLFGIQSGGRTESILMSLPPVVQWHYDWQPEPGSHEASLYNDFLRPRDWLGLETSDKKPL